MVTNGAGEASTSLPAHPRPPCPDHSPAYPLFSYFPPEAFAGVFESPVICPALVVSGAVFHSPHAISASS